MGLEVNRCDSVFVHLRGRSTSCRETSLRMNGPASWPTLLKPGQTEDARWRSERATGPGAEPRHVKRTGRDGSNRLKRALVLNSPGAGSRYMLRLRPSREVVRDF